MDWVDDIGFAIQIVSQHLQNATGFLSLLFSEENQRYWSWYWSSSLNNNSLACIHLRILTL